jgi:hypothetical protein
VCLMRGKFGGRAGPEFLNWTAVDVGVPPTVVSSDAISTEIETGFHIEPEAPVRINVLPD